MLFTRRWRMRERRELSRRAGFPSGCLSVHLVSERFTISTQTKARSLSTYHLVPGARHLIAVPRKVGNLWSRNSVDLGCLPGLIWLRSTASSHAVGNCIRRCTKLWRCVRMARMCCNGRRMLANWPIDTDPQLQEAALPHMLVVRSFSR